MSHELSLREIKKEWHGTVKSYVIGFMASLLLTSLSFFLVIDQTLSGPTLIYTIIGLATLQAIFQLLFFLHLGQEPKPRWGTLLFGFTILVLLIVVIGTIWVMNDLNRRMMPNMHTEMTHD